MLINHTAHEPDNDKTIDAMVGEEYPIVDRIMMLGTGSEKMLITACSEFFKPALSKHQESNYGSIEIRTKGIIIHLNNGQWYHVWCIPFYRLAIYQTDSLSIHAEGKMIRFQLKKNQNKSFLQKLLTEKAKYSQDQYPF